jgi:DNA replication protein DnaC
MMEQIEGRIRSRLEDPDLVTRVYILAPDYRNPTDDSGASRLSSLTLHSDQTFSSFDDRRDEGLPEEDLRSLEKALKTATGFAKKPRGWLVFTGPYGCGKTHLAASIANARSDLGQSTIFIGVPDLLDHLRATFNPSSPLSMDQVFEEIRAAPLLILDDLGAQSSTPWAKEKLFQLFDYRYNAKLPTIITTASYTEEIDPRLVSRMEDTRLCTICPITTPSYRGASPKKGSKQAGRSKSSG